LRQKQTMMHLHIQSSRSDQEDDSDNDQPKQLYEEETIKNRITDDRNFLLSELRKSQQEVAALKYDLKELRDETDQEYVIAVTFAAKERDELNSRIEELTEERDRLKACGTLQQVHIDALTKELIDLSEESQRLLRGTKTEGTSDTTQPEVIEIKKYLDLILHGMEEFKACFQVWLTFRQRRTSEVAEQDVADSRDDGVMQLEDAFDTFQKTIEGHHSIIHQDTFSSKAEDYLAMEGNSTFGIKTMEGNSTVGIKEIVVTEEEKKARRARRRSTSSALKQAFFIQEAVQRQSFLKSWVFGFENSEELDLTTEQLLCLKKETDHDSAQAIQLSK
jgi:hypothetical protein